MDLRRTRRRLSGKGNLPLKTGLWSSFILFRDLPLPLLSIKWLTTMESSRGKRYPPCVASQGGARRGAHGPSTLKKLWRGTWIQVPTSTGKSMHMGYTWIAYTCQFCMKKGKCTKWLGLARWLVTVVVHFFPLSFLSWWKRDPYCWWKEPQCEGTEKKVLRPTILWHFIEDLIIQSITT